MRVEAENQAARMKRDHWEQNAQARTCRGSASSNNINAAVLRHKLKCALWDCGEN